jgi:putative SOS response-associated peptidase YedK
MCARFELVNLLRFRDSARFHMVDAALWGADRLDIRPTEMVPVIVSAAVSTRDLVAMRWGLVPHWATDIRMGTKAINARAERIEDKPFFRRPLRRSRYLITATGFFEWRLDGTRKVKYRFAGLYDTWRDPRDPDGQELRSCTMITTTPNDLVAQYHHRMPVMLPPRDEETWLDPELRDVAAITSLLRPFPADSMYVQAV